MLLQMLRLRVFFLISLSLATSSCATDNLASSSTKCGMQPDGSFVICEGPPPSTALAKFELRDLKYVRVVEVAKGVLLAKIVDPQGVLHTIAVGDRVGPRGHIVRSISLTEVVLRARIPDAQGFLREEITSLQLVTAAR